MDVATALRNSKKGRLKYDRYWAEEGRTKVILDEISKNLVTLTISPKTLLSIKNDAENETKETDIVVEPVTPPKKHDAPKKLDTSDAYIYQFHSEMVLPIIEYEEDRLKSIQEAFRIKQMEYENHSKELCQQSEQEYHLLKRKLELDSRRRAAELARLEELAMKEAKEREALKQELYQNQAKKLSAKVQEAELKQRKAEEELRKQQREQEELRLQLYSCQQEGQSMIAKCTEKLNACENQMHLGIPVDRRMSELSQLLGDIDAFVHQVESKALSIDDILSINRLVKKACELFQEVTNDMEQARLKALHEHEKLVASLPKQNITSPKEASSADAIKQSKAEDEKNASSVQPQNMEASKAVADVDKSSSAKELVNMFIAPDAVKEYSEIMENLKKIEDKILSFTKDNNSKKYRFELQKSINLPINSVSSCSGSHVRDKIDRLVSTLKGKPAVVHDFCANLIAKQFVDQADKQISSQHLTAFPIAMAIVGVWARRPEVGPLILGHFYNCCPYLVPYYPPREIGQTDMDYYKSLGYLYDGGVIEKQHIFLNRISGYARLYAAIVQSPLPPRCTDPHPHSIDKAWAWFTRTLNMDPHPDVTATLLYDFLDCVGHMLEKCYGKQFKKILHVLCKDYFHKIKRVTPSGSGGPVDRLETFLQLTIKRGSIAPPEGMLGPSFWNR